jgi:hypothetical protein
MNEDQRIALEVKRLIDKQLLGGVRIFVSADGDSIQPGDAWLDGIVNAIQECSAMLVIATPDSVARPWVNFESGGGWSSGKRVIPCCTRGMTSAGLPAPLNRLQSLELANPEHVARLISLTAKLADLRPPEDIDYTDICTSLAVSWAPIVCGVDEVGGPGAVALD